MPHDVFTYGSLMFAPVWKRVVQGEYRSVPASLEGHARFALVNDTYPGIVECPGARVDGRLYLGVSASDMQALDAFEGAEYERRAVQVKTVMRESGQACTQAQTYVFLALDRLSGTPWEPEKFALERFLASYCGGHPDS